MLGYPHVISSSWLACATHWEGHVQVGQAWSDLADALRLLTAKRPGGGVPKPIRRSLADTAVALHAVSAASQVQSDKPNTGLFYCVQPMARSSALSSCLSPSWRVLTEMMLFQLPLKSCQTRPQHDTVIEERGSQKMDEKGSKTGNKK